MSQEDEKWACSYCTYENWPKSIKCTICLSPRPQHLISDVAHPSERDIYKMAPLITESENKSNQCEQDSSSAFSSNNPYNKWACPGCTYLNWPRATKCTQCLTTRNGISPTSPTSMIFNVEAESSTVGQTLTDDGLISPKSTLSDSYHNDRNKSWTRSIKWICAMCTYENWPKSQKCILCHTNRPKLDSTTSRHISPDEENKSRTHIIYNDNNQHLSPPGTISTCSNANNGNRRNIRCTEVTERQLSSTSGSHTSNNYLEERRLRQLRRKAREIDWAWLNACTGVVDGDAEPVIQYLSLSGDPTRQLTASEVSLLGRPSAFDVGHTLIHLAIRFQREDLLPILLSNSGVSHPIAKRVPSDMSKDIAADIRRHISASLKQRKGDFSCYFVTEFVTFALPAEIEDFSPPVQQTLFDELLDRDVQKELEEESPIINWSLELTERLGSRLYALWNRSAGDCLLDSALQATWGVFDRDNTLRRSLGDSLCEAASILYPRWKEAETLQANLLQFSLDEAQWQEDWAMLLSLATQPGSALEQMHVFTLAHILRRPIIVYGVKYVKSFRGEALGFARFEGIYLPLLWEPSFCWKSPISLGYTRGHFSALVPMEPDSGDMLGAGANIRTSDDLQVVFLPLMTADHQLLPLHFLTQNEVGREEEIMRQWLDCCVTEGGILVAQQKIPKRPLLVAQMLEKWLDFYRTLTHRPLSSPPSPDSHTQGYSSDGDSDQE